MAFSLDALSDRSPLISDELEAQLKPLLERIEKPLTLVCVVDGGDKSEEMATFLKQLVGYSSELSLTLLDPGQDPKADEALDPTYLPATGFLSGEDYSGMVSEDKIHITPRRGDYCLLDRAVGDFLTHTIFQLPTKLGKGVLVSPTVHGNIIVGPTAIDIEDKEGTNTTSEGINELIEKAGNTVKDLPIRQVITSFAGLRAHDIRTPISIISSMTSFAEEDIHDEGKLRDDLDRIRTANTFLLSLIDDVLDISKIDSGKITLNPTPYVYEEHTNITLNALKTLCENKGLKYYYERRRKTGVIVADRVRLNQVIFNLISNAVKYTPPGGTVSYISDSEDLPDNTIRFGFELRDTGIGMSEEFQKVMVGKNQLVDGISLKRAKRILALSLAPQ